MRSGFLFFGLAVLILVGCIDENPAPVVRENMQMDATSGSVDVLRGPLNFAMVLLKYTIREIP